MMNIPQIDTNRRIPSQEFLLQGSVLDESIEMLLHRIRGMCDSSEDGLVRFKQHEMIFSCGDGSPSGIISVRVKRQLNQPEQPWLLCYLGNPEVGDKNRLATIRTCVEVNCGQNVCAFLQELGFTKGFEFVSQGWLFRKNRLRATVSKVFRMPNPLNPDQLIPLTKSHLIEVSMISSSSSGNEQASQEVHSFSEQLKPLVHLDKIDPRRLQ